MRFTPKQETKGTHLLKLKIPLTLHNAYEAEATRTQVDLDDVYRQALQFAIGDDNPTESEPTGDSKGQSKRGRKKGPTKADESREA